MIAHDTAMTLFDRLRRSSVLRVLIVLAAMIASQNCLACAFEAGVADQVSGIESIADGSVSPHAAETSTDDSDDKCCTLCFNCAHCGGHCSGVSLPASHADLGLAAITCAKISLATTAPRLWTPPTLLRPPIEAA